MTVENRHSDIGILKEIAELLNEGTELNTVLSEVLSRLLHITGLETGWIFLIDEQGDYQLPAKVQLPPALTLNEYRPMCEGGCWCVDRYQDGRLNKATNIFECKRLEDAINNKTGETNGLTHHATVPLRAGAERFGVLNVGSPYKTHFKPEELALLEAVAFQIGTAIKRIRLTLKEQEMALAAERNRLARDLHDSVNQLLFSLSLTARAGTEMTDQKELKETFSYIQDLAQEAQGEMRALIWQLRPRGLENGIICALAGYADLLGLRIETEVKGVASLPGKVEEALWRIGQEALGNCKKHSQAEKVQLTLEIKTDKIQMSIEDEGCGFIMNPGTELPSLGLKSMEARARALGGTTSIISKPGHGTSVIVQIPI
ncbi:GAF domain-containing sensor histidine kinase [Mesobacillus subterraneus]|uniref:histidine kinase n=1 Tax=Mesobacillus subterraneus TaxID=285983 RepID=A0A3R9FJ39_9BACI|nr:GAF domain-containing sensor histidine kinase [Mesobacillus subterraneus]RSD29212.1 GAF domain-containing protein [Mesobacillus subterraneus]